MKPMHILTAYVVAAILVIVILYFIRRVRKKKKMEAAPDRAILIERLRQRLPGSAEQHPAPEADDGKKNKE